VEKKQGNVKESKDMCMALGLARQKIPSLQEQRKANKKRGIKGKEKGEIEAERDSAMPRIIREIEKIRP